VWSPVEEFPWVGSSFAFKYQTMVEVIDTEKHSSLLRYEINYGGKMSYGTSPRAIYYKTFMTIN
jgi:hypothetical protein